MLTHFKFLCELFTHKPIFCQHLRAFSLSLYSGSAVACAGPQGLEHSHSTAVKLSWMHSPAQIPLQGHQITPVVLLSLKLGIVASHHCSELGRGGDITLCPPDTGLTIDLRVFGDMFVYHTVMVLCYSLNLGHHQLLPCCGRLSFTGHPLLWPAAIVTD